MEEVDEPSDLDEFHKSTIAREVSMHSASHSWTPKKNFNLIALEPSARHLPDDRQRAASASQTECGAQKIILHALRRELSELR